ncbi:MAG TPA: BrnT family toxin [Coriobacteriia bacterium]
MVYFLYISGADVEISFEFDEAKSRANEAKHGIGFVEAQALWLDERLFEDPVSYVREPRSIAVGMIAGRHWTAVITYRGERIRIISVRRSRAKEVASYEEDDRGE